jgi:two-component system nitrogen regulation sensor histidine kinase NtrY
MLQLILDATPTAMLVVSETGHIAFTNAAARRLFFDGRQAQGENFLQLLGGVSAPLREALLADEDQIFTFEEEGQRETYHLARSHLDLDGQPHTLISVRNMTSEVSRQEIAVLKRTLRVIGHELANSLAPASSLLHSARQMLDRPELRPRLDTALSTVEERLGQLQGFVGGLAKLGKLPRPSKRDVAWAGFLDGLRPLWPGVRIGPPPPAPGWFDAGQIQQVLINLVKNAHEAGGPADGVALEVVTPPDGGVEVTVCDRGQGMNDVVMSQALVPSFTTKPTGSGMGLPLCHEIVDAHDGRLRLARRQGGGMAVSFWLPSRISVPAASRARLSLSRSR